MKELNLNNRTPEELRELLRLVNAHVDEKQRNENFTITDKNREGYLNEAKFEAMKYAEGINKHTSTHTSLFQSAEEKSIVDEVKGWIETQKRRVRGMR